MAYLNQCNFIGNCADAPEIRTFNDGGKIATIRMAVTERYVDRSGEKKENTEWISCVFNGKNADTAERYITKGASIFVSGKYHTRSWQDQQGNKHYATEISVVSFQLLDKQPQSLTSGTATAQPQYHQPAPPQPAQPAPAPQYPTQPGYAKTYAPSPTPAPAPAPGSAPTYTPQPGYQSNDPDLPF